MKPSRAIDCLLTSFGLVRYRLIEEAVADTDAAHRADPIVTPYGVLTYIDQRTGRYS
jgi:hypothetical protein